MFSFNLLIKKGNCKRHKRRGNHGMTPEDWKWVRHNFWPLHILFVLRGIPCSWKELFCWSIIYQKNKKGKRKGSVVMKCVHHKARCHASVANSHKRPKHQVKNYLNSVDYFGFIWRIVKQVNSRTCGNWTDICFAALLWVIWFERRTLSRRALGALFVEN